MAAADPPYRIVDLGPLGVPADVPDPDALGTFDINAHDQVAFGRDVAGTVIPMVWLPVPAYGRPGGPSGASAIDLLAAFNMTSEWTTGIALDINDDGIVVGQVGGWQRDEAGSRAAWWNLNDGTWGLIEPPAPPGGAEPEPWQDWTRAIAVSEGSAPSILVESWASAPCPNETCGFITGTSAGFVNASIVTLPASSIGVSLTVPPGSCFPGAVGRDVRALGTTSETIGSSNYAPLLNFCPVNIDPPCRARTAAVRWVGTAAAVLPDLGATGVDARGSEGRGFDDDGAFVGWAFDVRPAPDDCLLQAVLWGPGGTGPTVLPSPIVGPDEVPARAEGLTTLAGGGRRAVGWDFERTIPILWTEDLGGWSEELLSLSTAIAPGTCPDAVPLRAFDISPRGWIVAQGAFDPAENMETINTIVLIPRASPACAADPDADGDVDLDDLLSILSNFGAADCLCAWCPSDIDLDGSVGFGDILLVLGSWGDCTGASGPPQTVQDCFEKFGSDPIALEACLEAIANGS